MLKKDLAIGEAIGIGCIVFTIVFALIAWPFGMYLVFAIPAFVIAIPTPIITGVLIGKYVTKTRVGTWLGAVLGAILGYFLFYSMVSGMVFD